MSAIIILSPRKGGRGEVEIGGQRRERGGGGRGERKERGGEEEVRGGRREGREK